MWRDAARLLDMLQAAHKVLEYTQTLTDDDFFSNSLVQDATLRQLTIVGEATKRVSMEFRSDHPEIPWRRIAGFRDVVVHDYFRVDLPEVWHIVQEDIPALVEMLKACVPSEDDGE